LNKFKFKNEEFPLALQHTFFSGATVMFTSGDVLFSRFEVLSPSPVVETPAFSIWRARDRKREQDVAVKVYHEDVVKSALDRFNALKSAKDKYLIGDVEILRQYSVYKHGDKIK
jgi:hypothetical protein